MDRITKQIIESPAFLNSILSIIIWISSFIVCTWIGKTGKKDEGLCLHFIIEMFFIVVFYYIFGLKNIIVPIIIAIIESIKLMYSTFVKRND